MQQTITQALLAFHRKYGHEIQARPGFPTEGTMKLRKTLVKEEYKEFMVALKKCKKGTPAFAELADACADLVYVVVGTAISFGIDFDAVFKAVQHGNMTKGFSKRNDGKTLKDPNWKHPDIEYVISHQRSLIKERGHGKKSK